jgi:hypothetical protein
VIAQIYEVSTPEEARAISEIGVDHVGVLVGNGEYPSGSWSKGGLAARRLFGAPRWRHPRNDRRAHAGQSGSAFQECPSRRSAQTPQ